MPELMKKAKQKHVALSEVKMDCRCRKLSPFFSVSFGRLSVNKRKIVATFLSNVACRRNPLEGLRNGEEGRTGIILCDL